MKGFRQRLGEGVIVCDGAMGTMLYSRGIFINQCFDALNLTAPDLILGIHADYCVAGAEIIETNTFGANLVKLASFGFEGKLEEINRQGVLIAREASKGTCYVAGSIGPVGKPLAPIGKIPEALVRESVSRQAIAMIEAGCDLIILETYTSLREIVLAIDAIRDVDTVIPLVALITFTDNDMTLQGETPEQVASTLSCKPVDIIGANCSHGPTGILEVIERMERHTSMPLAAQPNAGMPRLVEGRFLYLSSPEYLAEYAKHFIQAGVSLIGGCCGTTPAHIKAMAAAVRALQPRRSAMSIQTHEIGECSEGDIVPLHCKSPLAAKIGTSFIRVAELSPPGGTDPSKALLGAQKLKNAGFDAVNIPDGPRATARMSPLALSMLIKQKLDMQVILHYCCRDRNILGMQSDLLGLHALAIKNLLIITGDPPKLGDYPDATAVFDVDSIGLTRIVHGMNHGYDLTGKSIGQPTSFLIAVGANPAAVNFDVEIQRLQQKIENGAELILTQPIFDINRFMMFLEKIGPFKRPVLMGLLPLASYRNAEFLHNEVPGMSIPLRIRERLRRAHDKKHAQQIGIEEARLLLDSAQPHIAGVYVMPPFGRYETAIDLFTR